MRVLVLTMAALMLTACVSQDAVLVNERGQAVRCRNSGWGYIGAPVAMSQQKACMKNAQAQGYRVPAGNAPLQDPPPPAPAPPAPDHIR